MQSMIQSLYESAAISSDGLIASRNYQRVSGASVQAEQALLDALRTASPGFAALFKQYQDSFAAMMTMECNDAFRRGLSAGVLLMHEILNAAGWPPR